MAKVGRPKKRFYSLVKNEHRKFIIVNEKGEKVAGQFRSRGMAEEVLDELQGLFRFKDSIQDLTREQIMKRMKQCRGRLQRFQKVWTLEEVKAIASLYDNRTDFYRKSPNAYNSAWKRPGWLDEVCSHMRPSHKKHKYVLSVLNPNVALAKIFDYKTHREFAENNTGAYQVLLRYGVDSVEIFDNLDDAEYLKNLIRKIGNKALEKFVENNHGQSRISSPTE